MCWKYCTSSEFHRWEKWDWQLTVSPSKCESDLCLWVVDSATIILVLR